MALFNDKNNNDNSNAYQISLYQELGGPDSTITFIKDFSGSQASVDADYSAGSGTGTWTVTRSASTPATYVTAAGIVVTQTDANPRWTQGFYDDTGFVSSPGLMMEPATTNRVPKSSTIDDATWTESNTVAINNDVGSTSPDGTATAPSLTASAGNGTLLLTTAVTAQTYSVWLKRKTGTGVINITADSGSTWTAVTVLSTWARFQVTAASASQTCGIRIVTSGDAVYVWGNQFEAVASATSLVPTTSAALTRNAETLSYATADNLNNVTNSIFVQLTTFLNAADYASNASIFSTTADAILLQFNTNDQTRFLPNSTDNSTVLANTGIRNARFQKNVLVGVSHGASAATNAECYRNVDYVVPTTTNYTEPSAGSAMSLGANPVGIYHALVIYSDNKAKASVNSIVQTLGYTRRAMLMPLGDSITRGSGDADDFGYRDHLQTLLGNNTYLFTGSQRWPSATPGAGPSIFSAGVAGDKTTDILARLSDELTYINPEKRTIATIVMMIGTNDVSAGTAGATIVSNVSLILDRIQSFDPSINVYIMNCIPRNDGFNSGITTYNGLLNTMVSAYDKDNLYYIDMNSIWLANSNWIADWMADTVHPNDTGYQQIANAIYAAMQVSGEV